MGAFKTFLATIGVVLGVGVLALGGAMAVSESRNWILDEVAKTSNIYKTAVEEKDNLKIKIDELENQQSEHTITEKNMAWVNYNPVGNLEQFFQRGDCPVGYISYDKNLIKSEIIDTVIYQYVTGSLLEIENYGSLQKQDNTYQVSQDCENIVEIYDVTGRLVDFTELKDDVNYTLGLTHKATFADDNTVTKVITRIDLAETIEAKENIVELQTGTYKAMMDDGYSYSTFTLKNENGNQMLEYIDYGYDSETETFTQSEILTGTFSISDGVISILLEIDEIPVECEIVENGFIYGGVTFTYQEDTTQTTELQSGKYCYNDEGTIDQEIYYELDLENNTFLFVEGSPDATLTGQCKIENGKLLISYDNFTYSAECELVENGFVYQGSTFTYQE